MTFSQIIAAQLVDPFRIVLLIGLVITMLRNRATTGVLLPLLAGTVFVAVLIPSTLTHGESAGPFWDQVLAGLISNAAVLAVLMALVALAARLRRS